MDLPKGFGGNAATPLAHMMADYQTPSPESTALFRAALAGSKHGVEESIKNGAKVNYFHRPEDFKNALHVVRLYILLLFELELPPYEPHT